MEFFSGVKWRTPPLEVLPECRNSFPNEAGNRPSSQDEEGEPALLLSCDGTLSVPLEWIRVCRGTS